MQYVSVDDWLPTVWARPIMKKKKKAQSRVEQMGIKVISRTLRTDLDLRGVVVQTVQSTAVVTMRENEPTFVDRCRPNVHVDPLLMTLQNARKCWHKDPVVSLTMNIPSTEEVFVRSFHFRDKKLTDEDYLPGYHCVMCPTSPT